LKPRGMLVEQVAQVGGGRVRGREGKQHPWILGRQPLRHGRWLAGSQCIGCQGDGGLSAWR
jgi:hypothetical protein